jgi:glycosyltransferase involved in cell wall biosynthesis
MNILFVCHVFHPSVGGIETSALLLIREFLALGHGLRVLTHSELGQASEMAAFPVFRRPSLREQLRLAAWADVVYQHNPSLTYLLPLEWKGRGAVSVHTWVSRTDGRRSLRDRLKLAWLGRWPVIANSRAMARALPMPATVIENGYDDRVFDTIGAGGFEAREGAVFVGRLVSDKGARFAVEAIAALRDAGRPMPLSLVGEGPERAALEAEVRARGLSGLVHFAGRLPPGEVAALLRRARYLLVPSLWEEPFGIVALEGIACGCLVVATDGGGLADAVGDCGLLVPRGDAGALARAITRLEEDATLRARLAAARAAHLDAHRPRTVAERHLAVLAAHRSSVLHPSPPTPLPARGERGVVQPSGGDTDEPSSPSPRVRGEGRGEG